MFDAGRIVLNPAKDSSALKEALMDAQLNDDAMAPKAHRPNTHAMDPISHAREITFVLSAWDFPSDIQTALELALFRTYAVPGISGLLNRTGAFTNETRKRVDDTGIILSEILEHGPKSPRGSKALQRMNEMHARFSIPNEAFLYVLSAFVCEPVRWLERFGWRELTWTEITACTNYYRDLGERMGITGIPETYEGFAAFNRSFEDKYFRYAPSNAVIGNKTLDLLLGSYLPRGLFWLGRPVLVALLDAPLRNAMGFKKPPRWLQYLVPAALRLRARILARLPKRTSPVLVAERARRSYPNGYRIEEVGTFAPVACPLKQASRSRMAAE